MTSSLQVFVLRALKDNFVYVLHDQRSKETYVIDPSTFKVVDQFLSERGWSLKQIFCTHHHPDHVGGALELSQKYSAPIVSSKYDFSRISGASIQVIDQQKVAIGLSQGQVLEIPGHTLGHWALFLPTENWLFAGDTIFSAGCGKLLEGTAEQMFETFNKIKSAINDETKIWFGHEYTLRNLKFTLTHFPNDFASQYYEQMRLKLERGENSTPTTLKIEKAVNPFMRAQSGVEFKKIRELRDLF